MAVNIFNKYLIVEDTSEQPKDGSKDYSHYPDQVVIKDFDNLNDAAEYMQELRYSSYKRQVSLVKTMTIKTTYADVTEEYEQKVEADA